MTKIEMQGISSYYRKLTCAESIQRGEERPMALWKTLLNHNPSREPEAEEEFFSFFGCKPLKRPDSEN